MTPDDRRLYCGITSMRFTAQPDQQVMADRLLKEYGIFTVVRNTSVGPCIPAKKNGAPTKRTVKP